LIHQGLRSEKNASGKRLSNRASTVREFQDLGYEDWKKKQGYGKREATETGFSAVKRCLDETVRATTVDEIAKRN